jgi:hypothetical protein
MVVAVRFNGQQQEIASIEEFVSALDRFDREEQFELWLSSSQGQSICMLRNGLNAWLMFLRHNGDSGLTSQGNASRTGVDEYRLSNGQVDEYPLSLCIDLEQCYKAVAYFFVNEGGKPGWVPWRES